MSSQTGKNILFLAMIFEGHIPAAIQVINDLLFLGHNVTCYTLDTFENRLKKTGAKIKPISVGTISLPKEAPPIAVYGMTIEIFS